MELLSFLKKNKENARGIFAKGEIEIIEKQLNGIKLTQSERNRLSRNIRRKLKFISELSKFNEDFELKQGIGIKRFIDEIKAYILDSKYFSRINKIILFGSTAEGERTFRSDIDIAVEFYRIDKKEALKFRLEIMRNFNEKMDLQVYNFLPDKIKKDIDEKGKIIYERKDRRKDTRY